MVDAAPVREHVLRLARDGLGRRQLAVVSGVRVCVIQRLLNGDRGKGFGPSKRIRAHHASALLAVRPRLANLGARIDVDGTGTRRRLQALTMLGWTQVRLGRELGVGQTRVNQIINQDRVGAATALTVRDLYERLWNTPAPVVNAAERDGATRAKKRAAAAGWAPPMAWDDETIDDPAAEPAHDMEDTPRSEGEHGPARRISFEDVEFLLSTGCTVAGIAYRLKAKETTIERYVGVVRAGQQDTWRTRTAS